MPDRPPLPGIPRTHLDPRREPEPPAQRPAVPPPPEPAQPEAAPVPAPLPVPIERGSSPSMFSGHSRAKEYATLIGAVTAGLATIVMAVRPPPESATSTEVAQLREKLTSTEKALSQTELGQIKSKLDGIEQRLDLWQEQRDAESAANIVRDDQIQLLAELGFRTNGGSPMTGFPRPGEGLWETPQSPPPQHRTGQQWPSVRPKQP